MYFGDTKNMPYGEKSEEQLIEIAKNIFDFFEEKQVKAVVMACNTTSAVTYEKLKNLYDFKIYPIIQSVTGFLAKLPIKRLGIFATPATIKSCIYQREIHKINPEMEVFGIACSEWVKIVETRTEKQPQAAAIIRQNLEVMLENKPEKIVLGCTHYPFLLPVLKTIASEDLFIDPADYFAEYIKSDLIRENLQNTDNTARFEKFYVSADPENFKKSGAMFYQLENEPKLVLPDNTCVCQNLASN